MKKLCILFGGASAEHDISVITGMQLAKNVSEKYDLEKIYLGLDNNFYLATEVTDICFFQNKSQLRLKQAYLKESALWTSGKFFNKKICDIECVINCCHGGAGENGDIAGLLDINQICHTGSDSLSAHIAMDKNLTKMIVNSLGIPTVKGVKITKENFENQVEFIKSDFADDLIVKPNSLGSSIGVKACDHDDFESQTEAIFLLHDDTLVEERIVDIQELNQACLRNAEQLLLSAIENPLTKSDFLTFEDKYKRKEKSKIQDRILPAKITKKLQKTINDYTVAIYKELKLNGVVRIDYIYDKSADKLYFNEVNTIPGSMSFYLYEPVGIDYITLVEILVSNATRPKIYSYFDTKVLTKNLI